MEKNIPQYPGVPQTVCMVELLVKIFDSPKSAIFKGASSAGLPYKRFSG